MTSWDLLDSDPVADLFAFLDATPDSGNPMLEAERKRVRELLETLTGKPE